MSSFRKLPTLLSTLSDCVCNIFFELRRKGFVTGMGIGFQTGPEMGITFEVNEIGNYIETKHMMGRP